MLLLPAILLAFQTGCTGPVMSQLVSSYPYGEQLVMDLSTDRMVGFVAEPPGQLRIHN